MQKIAHYAYLQTMIMIFSKRLLNYAEFSNLVRQPFEEILPALNNKGLDNIIKNLTQSHFKLLPAGNMDSLFLSVLMDDSRSIIRALSGYERDIFIYWIRRFELKNIKTIIRGKSLQHSKEDLLSELTPLGQFAVLPIDELLNADNIPEILSLLEKTPFASIARYGSKSFEQKQDVFTIETAINHQFFTGLNDQLKDLSDEEQSLLQPLLGRIIDQTNLMVITLSFVISFITFTHLFFISFRRTLFKLKGVSSLISSKKTGSDF